MSPDLVSQLDEVLFTVWDPIGVSDEPMARGEYTAYVEVLLSYIEARSEPEALAERLRRIASINMGVAPKGNERQVADRAYALYAAAMKDDPSGFASPMTLPTPPDPDLPAEMRWTTTSERRLDGPPAD